MSSLDGLRLAKLAQKRKDVQSKAEPVLINSGLQKHNEVGPTVYSNTLEQDALQLPAALKHYWWGSLCDVMLWYNHRLHHVVVRWSVICVAATLFTLSNTVTIIVTHTNWMKQYCHVVGGYMSAKPITSSKGFRWTITCTIMLKNISV